MDFCCTCANTLPINRHDEKTEKPLPDNRPLACCNRVICGKCIRDNNRFAFYCPFCQISSAPSVLPQGLRDPPSYSASSARPAEKTSAPPPYASSASARGGVDDEKAALAAEEQVAEDTLHFLDHNNDSILSLSLRYGVPATALRRTNNLASDHLLLGRRTVLIPGEFYKGGVSLSPRPVEGEEEELRKSKVRRFMTATKVSDYDVALLYLQQSGYDLSAAMEAHHDDEVWEREHPMNGKSDKKAKKSATNRGPFWRGL